VPREIPTVDERVVQVGQGHGRRDAREGDLHQPAVGGWGVGEPERHPLELVQAPRCRERGLGLGVLLQGHNVEGSRSVDAAEDLGSGQLR
jgi:hypothetical protein